MSTRAPERPAPARTPIDPRIRARRVEVQRDEGRRRLRRLVVVLCALSALAGLYALTLTPLLDIDHIRVQGADHSGEAAVVAALDIRRGDALLTADVDAAARALTALPWVATAEVRRAWPGSLSVRVVERTPIAAIQAEGGGWVLVDRGGRQLAVEAEPALELVRVAGLRVAPALAEEIDGPFTGVLDLAAVVPPSLRPAFASLWPKADGTVDAMVELPTGETATARFGVADQLEAKIVALAAVLERADLAGVRVIDLRVPDAPALTRG